MQATVELIDLAAQQLLKWNVRTTDWGNDGKKKRRLAQTLSEYMMRNPNLRANRLDVKVNWVTHHRQSIERRRVQKATEQR